MKMQNIRVAVRIACSAAAAVLLAGMGAGTAFAHGPGETHRCSSYYGDYCGNYYGTYYGGDPGVSSGYVYGGPGSDSYVYGEAGSGGYVYGGHSTGGYVYGGPGASGYAYGGPGTGSYVYGGPGAAQQNGSGSAQVTIDQTVRAYPGWNTNVPDSTVYELPPDYWQDWYDDDDDDPDDDDWWYYNGGPGVQYGQGWRYSPNGWWFQLYGGGWLSNGWQLIRGRWYRFDAGGYMMTGWFTDGDGSRYYLNPVDDGTLGMMRTGWQLIDGKSYYFNTQSDGTMGRLYVNTTTPDGYRVGPDGALIQ